MKSQTALEKARPIVCEECATWLSDDSSAQMCPCCGGKIHQATDFEMAADHLTEKLYNEFRSWSFCADLNGCIDDAREHTRHEIAQAFEQYEQKLEICKKALQAQAYLDSGFAPPLFNVMPTRQLIAEALEKIK